MHVKAHRSEFPIKNCFIYPKTLAPLGLFASLVKPNKVGP